MYVSIDTSEVRDLAHDLNSTASYMNERVPAVVSKTGHDLHARWAEIVPVLTGFLKSSGDLQVVGTGFDFGPTAEYGGYVELGTSRMGPQPALGPAYDEILPTFEDALGHLGEQAVSGV